MTRSRRSWRSSASRSRRRESARSFENSRNKPVSFRKLSFFFFFLILILSLVFSPSLNVCFLLILNFDRRQERLEFLYDSGLAVGKSSGFKALESLPTKTDPPDSTAASSSASKVMYKMHFCIVVLKAYFFESETE